MVLIKDEYLKGFGSGKTWKVEIDPPKSVVRSYFQESIDTARFVYENKTGKLLLLYSGGLDSQYVFNLFRYLKFDFDPVIIRLLNNKGSEYNDHETQYAFDHCKNCNIEPVVFDLNFDNFVETGKLIEVAKLSRCGSFHIPATLYVANQLNGFTVLGNDPPYLRYNGIRNVWQLEELEIIHSLLRYYEKEDMQGCPFFLSYSAEMMLSFLLDPAIKKLAHGAHPGKKGSNSTKVHVFNNGSGFNMPNYNFQTKTRIKYTGYEKIIESPICQHENFLKFRQFEEIWRGEYLVDYDEIVAALSINQNI